ncbi:AraC family transcriptional regulator [Thalassococcus sp. S3]|uniref:helix-turn-helix domain-containing protein n=1 Tax=Thalassococcus sp. S3 TaxID=2017482 RepID=UPI00102C4D7D|nr:helix-turn-helix domain-containing protein [Thalassococcus sp. S3]
MLLFPLPFLTAFFLIFILLYVARHVGRGLPYLALITISAYALQSVLMGVHWGLADIPRAIIASLAIVLPPLTWLTLNTLAGRISARVRVVSLVGTVLLLILLNAAFYFQLSTVIELAGILVYLLFGLHLVWLGWHQELDWMANRPLHAVLPTQRAFFLTGALLLISAGVDAMVAVDIRLNDSQISSALVGYSNLTLLLILVLMFFRVGSPPRSVAVPEPALPGGSSEDDDGPTAQEILDLLDAEMEKNHLYRSENLSLNQIARRIRLPARQVSSAVNSLRAMNVPQYVNTFRIKDACRILEETDMPVTEIVFAVGFTTKSNFNREFQRVTGVNPSEWRTRSRKFGASKDVSASDTRKLSRSKVTS